MGTYCPHCHHRVSHKWFAENVFCDEHCKQSFIKNVQKTKIEGSFNNSKSKRQIRRKQYARNS